MALKVSEKIEKQREVLAAKQAAQNAARDRQQQLLDTPLSKITSQQIELMDSATYKAMLVKHGEAFAAKSLPLPTGVRRVVSSDSTAPVFTRDVLARQISPEHQALIDDSIRKSRLAEVEEGARIRALTAEGHEEIALGDLHDLDRADAIVR